MCDFLMTCIDCEYHGCNVKSKKKFPTFCPIKKLDAATRKELIDLYSGTEKIDARLTKASILADSEFYCAYTRVEETVAFIKKLGYKRVGIAYCAGLIKEAEIFAAILRQNDLEAYGAICKIGMIDKCDIGIENEIKHNPGYPEAICNPILQTLRLRELGTEINVLIGLCVGHDSIFYRYSDAPTTTLIVKDRVQMHNSAATLYGAESFYKGKLTNIDVGKLLDD